MFKRILLFCTVTCFTCHAFPQFLTTPPNGGNKKSSVSERIGVTDVTIHYDRPAVKGREGKIWNGLVHTGFKDLGFGTSKAAPWRAGANENTTISFSTDVLVEGKPLKAGIYGFFVAYDKQSPVLIFSNNSRSWGSFFYNEKEDALRVTVKPVDLNESIEWLTYQFTDEKENSAVVALMWEKLKIPFTIEVDLPKTQMEVFRNELRGDKGFRWENFVQAADFAVQNNTGLDEALAWSDYSINSPFTGQKNFFTLSTHATVLARLGRTNEADAAMKEALPMASVTELHQYGRKLISEKKTKEALEIFKLNAQKNPNNFTTSMGLARGYSATGDYKNALKYARAALPLAPNKLNKDALEDMIKTLAEGKDINQ